jgi:hypothetical protein
LDRLSAKNGKVLSAADRQLKIGKLNRFSPKPKRGAELTLAQKETDTEKDTKTSEELLKNSKRVLLNCSANLAFLARKQRFFG